TNPSQGARSPGNASGDQERSRRDRAHGDRPPRRDESRPRNEDRPRRTDAPRPAAPPAPEFERPKSTRPPRSYVDFGDDADDDDMPAALPPQRRPGAPGDKPAREARPRNEDQPRPERKDRPPQRRPERSSE